MAPAAAASLQPELGLGNSAFCLRPIVNAFRVEQPGNTTVTRPMSNHVSRAGRKFMASSRRAPHQPKRRYSGVLNPTIESIVLTTLNTTRPGIPRSAYQKIALTKPRSEEHTSELQSLR